MGVDCQSEAFRQLRYLTAPDAAYPDEAINGHRNRDCSKIGVSGPTRRAEVRRDGHCE
jgi:hypothetical protein